MKKVPVLGEKYKEALSAVTINGIKKENIRTNIM